MNASERSPRQTTFTPLLGRHPQGEAVDLGGYYAPDSEMTTAVMRPSKTFNAALATAQG